MANRSAATFQKRQKEMRRQQKQQEKTARRKAAKEAASQSDHPVDNGEDPDIAGIVPGPQGPQPAWLELRRKGTPDEA